MADRIASASRFRAEGVRLSWEQTGRRFLTQAGRWHRELDPRLLEQLERASERGPEIALRWATSRVLGAPPGPFTVWIRPRAVADPDREVQVVGHPLGRLLTWPGEASVLDVGCRVRDGGRPVQVIGFRGAASPFTAVAAEQASGATNDQISLVVRASGMTCALLTNADDPSGVVDHLADVVRADDWEPWEVVGLPVGSGTDGDVTLPGYDDAKQGLVAALTLPADAARERVDRAAPVLGWFPISETGMAAPPWAPSDPARIVDLSRTHLGRELTDLFAVSSPDQAAQRPTRPIRPPEQGGRTSTAASRATVNPLGALLLPATSDPWYALALGFGTGYSLHGEGERLFAVDFLVTADYRETPEGGSATYAAYVPQPVEHAATAPVTGLAAAREGLIRPEQRDGPWRETIRVSWQAVESSVALGRPVGFSLLRFDPAGGGATTCLLDHRTTDDDWLPRVPTRDPSARNVAADPLLEIPLGSGGHSVGYAVAVSDVFGIWSTWEDTASSTPEPAAPQPRILSARLDASYVGSSSCPATLEVEIALDWSDRTVAGVDFSVLPFAATTTNDPSPVATPPGVTATLAFSGDVPSGLDVTCLDPTGTQEVDPGPDQSMEGRRYRVGIPLGALDYAATRYWAVALWTRNTLTVLGPGVWSPTSPVLAYAASPVPPALAPPPPLPGVPVGSTPDARGRSHVRVAWSDPAGPVDHFAVYEVTETALRSAVPAGALPVPSPTALPGQRLAELKTAYDSLLTPTRRREIFRRVARPAGDQRSADVELPRGSTDIHLFAVVAVAPAAIESPWPQSSTALQAFRAPTVLTPAPPTLRSSFVDVAGEPQLRLDVSVESPLQVAAFRLHRTTSLEAARAAETMGPAFATVAASDSGDPPSPTGTRRYIGHWQGVPMAGWRPVLHRAVAVPVASIPVEAVVGVPSPGSPVLRVSTPPAGPPDLEDLAAEVWDGTGIVVRTATQSPLFLPEAGPFVLRGAAAVGGASVFPEASTTLDTVASAPGSGTPGAPVPAGGDPGPAWVRDDRTARRTPLSWWFRRASVDDEVAVTVRLADPHGRVSTRTLVVPPEPPTPAPSLEVVDLIRIAGRGIVVTFRSDAPVDAGPAGPAVLRIVARRSLVPRFPLTPPLSLEIEVPDIPLARRLPPLTNRPIVVARTTEASPYEYTALLRVTGPVRIGLSMTGAEGASTSVTVDGR